MFYRFTTYLTIYCWLATVVVAQQVETVRVKTRPGPYLRFDPFTVTNEVVKQAYSKHMALQDSKGYLWFLAESNASRQLIRYDGNYSQSFGSDDWGAFNSDIAIRENAAHEIWTVTKKGFALFDPITETFRSFQNPFLKQPIASWVMEPGGKNWFAALEPLKNKVVQTFFEFDARTRRFRRIIPSSLINGYTKQPESQQSYTFLPKTVDAKGRVWGSVHTGPYLALGYYDSTTNALVQYPVSGFIVSTDEKKGPQTQKLDNLTDVDVDGKYIWIGSWNHMGLLRLDTETGHWKQFYFPASEYNLVLQIIPRNAHQLWLQTGIAPVVFDKITETLYAYPHKPDNAFTPDAYSRPLVLGNNQSVWLGLADRNNSATFSVLHESKQSFHVKADTLFALANESKKSGKKGRRLYYTYNTDYLNFAEYNDVSKATKMVYNLPLNGFFEQVLYAAQRDSANQVVWLVGKSAVGSMFRFDEKDRLMQPVRASIRGLPSGENQTENYDEIRAVVQDQAQNVWFPSFSSSGKNSGNLIKFDNRVKQFVGFRAGTHGLPVGQIRSAMADRKGQIWLGYKSNGMVIQFDPTTNQARIKLPDTHRDGTGVMKIVEDTARGAVWIARNMDGLWKYDQRTNTVRHVLREPVLNVHLTQDNVLWLRTLTSLKRFRPETGQLTRFGPEYDMHNFNWSPFSKTSDAGVLFETFRFYDHDSKPDTVKPRVVLSFLNVFDNGLQLPQSLNYTKDITLNYDQNFFTVGFSALSYFQSERNQYAYRLVKFNKDWVMCGNKPLATFTNVPPGDYQLEVKGSNSSGIWSETKTVSIRIVPPFWQTWWFRTLVALILIALLFSGYRFQLERRTLKARLETEEAKHRQKEAELKEKEAAFQLKISETEMAALRSQMNPHFIFNCLNSIQYFTARNDAEKATDYLTKFSRLIRLVLENSKSERVTLANELETLRLYIEMEIMRFQQKVQYDIQVAGEIDVDSIQIPPLLLQPFVENAIWHGLMQKNEGGNVWVKLLQPQPNRLRIEITDDGIGRAKSAEYKSKSATRHKSFGLKLTADRIELINQLYHTHTQVEVIDLVDKEGNASGTKIVIDIPV